MKFLKQHSYDIVKLFVNQLGLAIFSMALYSAVNIALPDNFEHAPTIRLVISIASTLFYLSIIYVVVWEFGAKDRIKVDSGRVKRSPIKGGLLQLCANIPNFVLVAIALVSFAVYSFNSNEGCKLVFSLIHSFIVFIESMYTGMIIAVFPVVSDATVATIDIAFCWRTIMYALMPITSVLVAQLGYTLGEHNFKFSSLLSGKKQKP